MKLPALTAVIPTALRFVSKLGRLFGHSSRFFSSQVDTTTSQEKKSRIIPNYTSDFNDKSERDGYSSTATFSMQQLVILGGVALALVFGYSWFSATTPENVRASNVYARSFSVGWVADEPMDGCVVAMPLLRQIRNPNFEIRNIKPQVVCARDRQTAQLVDFSDMTPQTTYRLLVLDGLRFKLRSLPRVTTLAIDEENPQSPQPAYGSVFAASGERVDHALVYVYTQTGLSQYPVGVLTNEQGNYALDLSNLMRSGNSFVVEGWSDTVLSSRIEADVRRSTPFPPLHLSAKGSI